MQKTNQKEFRIEKKLKTKGNKLYVTWKRYNNSFNSRIDKKDLMNESIRQYFLPYKISGSNIKIELDLSNYATKTDQKNVIHVNVSSFASKANLASLKTEVDKLYIAKLIPVDDDMSGEPIPILRHFEQQNSKWLGPPVLQPVLEVRPLFSTRFSGRKIGRTSRTGWRTGGPSHFEFRCSKCLKMGMGPPDISAST